MSYQSLVVMAGNQSLIARIGAGCAMLGLQEPLSWAQTHIWKVVSTEGWAEAWDYAESTKTVNVNPDTGARDDVISDQMIEDAINEIIAEVTP